MMKTGFVRFVGSEIVHGIDGRKAGLVTYCGHKREKKFNAWNFYATVDHVVTCSKCKAQIEALATGTKKRLTIKDYPETDPINDY